MMLTEGVTVFMGSPYVQRSLVVFRYSDNLRRDVLDQRDVHNPR